MTRDDPPLLASLQVKTDRGVAMTGSRRRNTGAAGAGAVYGLGLIGALIYFIQSATSFWDGLYGVFQAVFWPAYLVYGLFHWLNR
jgi:hypothetical protein